MMDLLLVSAASLIAGLMDAIVGGGGLILVPVLFASFPQAAPATLLGTNKAASVWGTSLAAIQYTRRVQLSWTALAPGCAAAVLGSLMGAWAVTLLSPVLLRLILPLVLLAVWIYTLAHKNLGQSHQPRFKGSYETLAICLIGGIIGFYDGFFGPGTGSFFVFLFVRWLGYDFLHASASAKVLNTMTNLAALTLFSLKGHVWWHLAASMAVANMVGSFLGTRLALKYGSGFVRWVFIAVVGCLIMKTAWDVRHVFI